MKKGSRSARPKAMPITIQQEGGELVVRWMMEARLPLGTTLTEAVKVAEEAEKEAASVTLDPPRTGTVPEDTSDNMLDLPFDPASAPASRAEGYKKRIATTQGKEV